MQSLFSSIYKSDENEVEFIETERQIEKLLLGSAVGAWAVAETLLKDYTHGSINSIPDLQNALRVISPELSNVHTTAVNETYTNYVDKAMMKGSRDGGGGNAILYALNRDAVRDGIVSSSKYYTNKYFNDQVIPMVTKGVEDVILSGESGRAVFNAVKNAIDEHYATVPYWNMVANVSASRSYHYGLLKGGSYAGYTTVTYSAVLDGRTSAVCRNLNGRTWNLYSALDILEQVSMAAPEDVKTLSPWLSLKEYETMTDDEMVEAGVICPPRHPKCRSILVLGSW